MRRAIHRSCLISMFPIKIPDRAWHDVEVPLRQYAGQTITLTLETDPGPKGDTTGDWAGWESPRVVYAVEQ